MRGMSENIEFVIGAITVVGALHVWASEYLRTRSERRQRTSELFQNYFSSDNYNLVIQPVFNLVTRLGVKEVEDKDAKPSEDWDMVLAGWRHAHNAPDAKMLAALYENRAIDGLDARDIHYLRPKESPGFSEHESLAVFLHFWTIVYGLWNNSLLDNKLAKDLFQSPWTYFRGFLLELEQLVQKDFEQFPGAEMPAWCEAVHFLDKELRPAFAT